MKDDERPEGAKCQLPAQLCPSANMGYSGFSVLFGANTVSNICKPAHAKSQIESRFLKKRLLELFNEHGGDESYRKTRPCSNSTCKNTCSGFVKTKPTSGLCDLTQYFCCTGCIVDYYSTISVTAWKAMLKKHKKAGAGDSGGETEGEGSM